jgi:hypothetical protein
MDHRTGSGGPTGCSEAFLTVMGDDGFLPGVLLLLHTVRKYAQVDRDFIVLVSTQVTDDVIERLLSECVRVVQVRERLSVALQPLVLCTTTLLCSSP